MKIASIIDIIKHSNFFLQPKVLNKNKFNVLNHRYNFIENTVLSKIKIKYFNFPPEFKNILEQLNILYLDELLNIHTSIILNIWNIKFHIYEKVKSIILDEIKINLPVGKRILLDTNELSIKQNANKQDTISIYFPFLQNEYTFNNRDNLQLLELSYRPINLPLRFRLLIDSCSDITTIKDILFKDLTYFKSHQNIGRKTIIDAQNRIIDFLNLSEYQSKDINNSVSNELKSVNLTYNNDTLLTLNNFNNLFQTLFTGISKRDLDISLLRWGNKNYIPTMGYISNIHNLSRERVRQILNKIIIKLNYLWPVDSNFKKLCLELLLSSPTPLKIESLFNSEECPIIFNYPNIFIERIISVKIPEIPFLSNQIKNFKVFIHSNNSKAKAFLFYYDELSKLSLASNRLTLTSLLNLPNFKSCSLTEKLILFQTIFNSKEYKFIFTNDSYILVRY